jgi:hypothetical protein
MNRFEERMLDRDLEELLGGERPEDLSGRILTAHSLPRRPSRQRRRMMPVPQGRQSGAPALLGIAISTFALAAVCVFALLLALNRPQPAVPREVAGDNSPRDAAQPGSPAEPGKKSEANEAPPERPSPDMPVKPPAESSEPPKPGPQREAHQPKPPAERPKEPEKPAETVEKPKPPPEETRPPTEQAPTKEPVVVARFLAPAKGVKLQLRYAEGEPWRDAAAGDLHAGVQLRAMHPADLALANGAALRLDGQIQIASADAGLALTLFERGTQAWLDNLGCKCPLTLTYKALSARLESAAAFVETNSLSLEFSCFHGTIEAGGRSLTKGQVATLGEKGLGKAREMTASEREPRLLAGLPARVLLREGFESEPAGGMYGGKLEGGAAKVSGQGGMIAFDIKPALINVPGATLRMRYRVSGCDNIYVQFLGVNVRQQFGNEFAQPKVKQGPWQDFEIRLDSLPSDSGARGQMPAALELGKFQCYLRGKPGCTLEIDWLEVVRVHDK